MTHRLLSLDLETEGFDPRLGRIRLISINDGEKIIVHDCFESDPAPILDRICSHEGVIVGHNLKFDQKWLLHHHHLELPRVFDTFRASNLIYNGKTEAKHDLWSLYRRELGIEPTVQDLGGSDWSGDLTPEQLAYASDDVEKLPRLYEILRKKIIDNGLTRVAQIEFQAILPEASMELNGFGFNKYAWMDLARANRLREMDLRMGLLDRLPHPTGQLSLPGVANHWNLGSPLQLLQSLRREGIRLGGTNEIELAQWAPRYPVIKNILEWRGYAQAVKSFGENYLENIHSKTGRIHTSFYPFTGAGRYASSGPNLQQIPRSKEFRACFSAPEGRSLVIADYSQIEIRIAAEVAGDEMLIEGYSKGADAYTMTAALISGESKVTKEQRQRAKAVVLGFVYGMQPPKFVLYAQSNYGQTFSLEEAEIFRSKFFDGYKGLAEWHRRALSNASRLGRETRTLAGRRRYLGEDAWSEYLNSPVQGTGADGLKASLRCVFDTVKSYARLVHMVHDEICLEVDDCDVERAKADLEQGMIAGMQPFLKRVPVVVEVGSGKTWAEK